MDILQCKRSRPMWKIRLSSREMVVSEEGKVRVSGKSTGECFEVSMSGEEEELPVENVYANCECGFIWSVQGERYGNQREQKQACFISTLFCFYSLQTRKLFHSFKGQELYYKERKSAWWSWWSFFRDTQNVHCECVSKKSVFRQNREDFVDCVEACVSVSTDTINYWLLWSHSVNIMVALSAL